MSDETTPDSPFGPSGQEDPVKKPADPPLEQTGEAPDQRGGRRRRNRSEDRLTSPIPGIVLFLFFLGLAALSVLLLRPPAALPESAPADEFSAMRAMPHVRALAIQPHPVGTPAHAGARDYLLGQLEQLGLDPEVQAAVSVRGALVVNVENVLARLTGSRSDGKAVLLMAHYDSVPTGPGASDNAAGVAALLETARALKASSRPPVNDVIFLFSDGEEQDLHGAAAFVEEHPWARDVGLVLNFDYRGRTGPSYTYETSPDNDWLISRYAEVAPSPLASSLMYEVYRHMPNYSDFNVFKSAGYAGLNLAVIGEPAFYHTVLDNYEMVDPDSLQHQGSTALALARQFGDLDLATAHSGDAVYFNAVGNHLLVHYSAVWIFPLVVIAALLWVGALVFGLRGKEVTVRGVLLGAAASLVVAAVLAGVGYLLWRLFSVLYPQYSLGDEGDDTYNSLYYWFAFVALGVGLAALLHSGLRTRIRAAELSAGALLLWLVLAVGVSIAMPGGSYILTWPLLFGSLGLWGWFVLRRYRPTSAWLRIAWLALFTIPAIVLIAPPIYMFYVALFIQQIWIPMAILGLLIGLLALPLAIIAQPRKSWLPALMGLIVVGFLVTGHLTSSYTSERPLRDSVLYAWSADNDQAYWISWNEPGAWAEQFLGEDGGQDEIRDIYPRYAGLVYKAPAPVADLSAPAVDALDTTTSGILHLRVVPTPGTWGMYLYTMPDPAPVTYYVDNKPIQSEGRLVYWAPPAEGFDLTVETPGASSLALRVVDHTLGLPTLPGFSCTPRPDWIIPSSIWECDSTMVAKTFTFERR